ncbi:MAG: histidine ammonia-lyase [Deltaproteobacteria bacterium]|nr:histidine ammonia-lyase [Deltaproteobacteria bacterium]
MSVVINGQTLSCNAVHAIANGQSVSLCDDAQARMQANVDSMPAGPSILEEKRHWLVGGFAEEMSQDELSKTFIIGHCAGVGEPLAPSLVRATMAARANVLAGGVTGSRPEAAQILVSMLNQGVTPHVPSQGSVGAAGDLAPLAHIARVACGYGGEYPDLPRYTPTPKEALSLINGISMTSALGAIATVRAQRVLDSSLAACAMTMEAVAADAGCIDARLLSARNHPGAVEVAAELRSWLTGSTQVIKGRGANAFSIRAAPAVLGTLVEELRCTETVLEREMNGAGDNPLLFDGEWVEGGNFHGAPVAQALDSLKIALTQLATISERRTFRLTYGQLSKGLPSFLVGGTGLNSGFMLTQYTAASLASECKGLAHPASVDTIPTVQHHEDHVSMGPIAARMLLETLECVADIVAIEVLLAAQALDLRMRGVSFDADGNQQQVAAVTPSPRIAELHSRVRNRIAYWEDDEVLHPTLYAAGQLVRTGEFLGQTTPW